MPRPIAARINHDHFGFYQIGPYKTYSKIEAIEISARTGTDLQWNFNNHVFENFNWTKEPAGTLDFWYGERARQIRDAYDYIVLMYSGGPDSWNMLKAFVDNNIYIDEITHYITKEGTPLSFKAEQNFEVVATSYPTAKKLIETNPTYKNTNHRIVDGGESLIKKMSTAKQFDYFYEEGNNYFGPWCTTFSEIRQTDPYYRKLTDQQKSVCFVWGYDKPLVVQNNRKFFINFTEMGSATFVKPKDQMKNTGGKFDEAFYWSPDMPEVPCKQAHIIKNFIEKFDASGIDGFYVRKKQNEIHAYKIVFQKNGIDYELSDHCVHKLLYRDWDINTIVCPKHGSPLLSPKDEWWYSTDAGRWYVRGVLHIRQHISKIHPKWWQHNDPKEKVHVTTRGALRGGIKNCVVSYNLN